MSEWNEITSWRITSDGTAQGTSVFNYDYEVDCITSIDISIKPGELVMAKIEFVARLESVMVNVDVEPLFNDEIAAYVKAELNSWLKDRDFKTARDT